MPGASQIIGFTQANTAEVEANTKALRATLRPEDYGALGIYSMGGASGTMAAALGTGATGNIFSFRWGNSTNLCLLKRVTISAGCIAAFSTAQAAAFLMFVARSFSASDSGGTALAPSGSQNKLRTTGMGSTLLTDARISSTAALTVGTRTLDTNSVGAIAFGAQGTAGAQILPPYPLFDVRPGEHPLVFAQNEGFVIQNGIALPATGTFTFAVRVEWSELAAY